jgi:hypothetical protein
MVEAKEIRVNILLWKLTLAEKEKGKAGTQESAESRSPIIHR